MTPEMRQTLTHVQEYFASHGVSPTMRELARIEGRKSTAGVHRRVHALVEAGYLVRALGERRKFEPAEANLSAVPTDQLRAELEKREARHG